MRFAIVGLALFWMIGTEGGVFEDNGMANIATIVSDIDDLSEAAKDLAEMETRLNGLDKHQALIAQTKSDLTDALNKDSLANNFNHENTENSDCDVCEDQCDGSMACIIRASICDDC